MRGMKFSFTLTRFIKYWIQSRVEKKRQLSKRSIWLIEDIYSYFLIAPDGECVFPVDLGGGVGTQSILFCSRTFHGPLVN